MCLLIHGHLRRFGRVDRLEFRIQFPLEYADIVGSDYLQHGGRLFRSGHHLLGGRVPQSALFHSFDVFPRHVLVLAFPGFVHETDEFAEELFGLLQSLFPDLRILAGEFLVQFPRFCASVYETPEQVYQNTLTFFEERARYILPIVDGYCGYTPAG